MAFLFGVTGRPELPGQVLHQLLTDLWMTPAAGRALIARMRREGHLESVRRGRCVDYRLAGQFRLGFQRVRDRPQRTPRQWTGAFHAVLYQVPESRRPYRDALRRNAILSGFGILQPGVLISLTDRSAALDELFGQVPVDARVYRTTIAMPAPDAARAAWTAWDLATVSAVYHDHIATLRAALRAPHGAPPPTADTLRRFVELARLPLVDSLRDPGLPPELTPPDWPGPLLHELTAEVNSRFAPAAHQYATSLLAD